MLEDDTKTLKSIKRVLGKSYAKMFAIDSLKKNPIGAGAYAKVYGYKRNAKVILKVTPDKQDAMNAAKLRKSRMKFKHLPRILSPVFWYSYKWHRDRFCPKNARTDGFQTQKVYFYLVERLEKMPNVKGEAFWHSLAKYTNCAEEAFPKTGCVWGAQSNFTAVKNRLKKHLKWGDSQAFSTITELKRLRAVFLCSDMGPGHNMMFRRGTKTVVINDLQGASFRLPLANLHPTGQVMGED